MSWVCDVAIATPWHFSFWFRVLAVGGAGMLGMLGTWNPTSSAGSTCDFFLGASACWLALACCCMHEAHKSKAASFDQEEENRLLLKESVLDDTAEDKDILARVKDKDHAGPIAEPQLGKTSSSSSLTMLKKHLAFFSHRPILDLIKNREESSSLGRGEAPHPSQVDEEEEEQEEETLSETESHETESATST
jgi:hypothetical protein